MTSSNSRDPAVALHLPLSDQILTSQAAKVALRQIIREAKKVQPTLSELIEILLHYQIHCHVNRNTISYQICTYQFSGTQLGQQFTLKGLQASGIQMPALTNSQLPTIEASYTLPAREDKYWENGQALLLHTYCLPRTLIDTVYQQQWLYTDPQSNLIFIERDFNDTNYHGLVFANGYFYSSKPHLPIHASSAFWLANTDSIERAVILDDPLEVLSIYALEQAKSQSFSVKPTLYLSARRRSQIPFDLIATLPAVYVSESCVSEIRTICKKKLSQATFIHPNHPDSWRGVWQDHQSQPQPVYRSSRPVGRQRQLEL